jgi:hypothetical protein
MPPNWDEGFWDEGFWDSPTPPIAPPLPTRKKPTKRHTMASNPTPEDDDVLCALAEDLADGGHLHEVAIGIKQNTEAVLRAAIAATNGSKLALGAANTAVDQKYDLLQAADAAGQAVIRNCKLRLAKLLGGQYNSSWEEAGFPNQSTGIPDSQDQRFNLLNGLKLYFTVHPPAESVDMEATAAICEAAHAAISDARAAVNAAVSSRTTAKGARQAAIRTLRKRVRGLIDELGTLLAEDDARYEAFGLNVPANPTAPEQIENLALSALGGGKVFLQWPYATRMVGTRIMVKRMGVDEEFASIGTEKGLEKMLTGQTPGQTLQIFLIAYNDGGDALPSPTSSVVVS